MEKKVLNNKFIRGIICILPFFLFFILLEWGCQIIEKKTRLEKILNILEQDPLLFWKQKNNLDIDFFGGRVNTGNHGLRLTPSANRGKKKNYRILVLGASPTFGWGVNNSETYAARLAKKLNLAFDHHVTVTNGSGIGYSSYQGLRFLKKNISRLKPDLITVSYVINDVDNYRFFQNNGLEDKKTRPVNKFTAAVNNWLNRAAFYRVFKKLVFSIKPKGQRISTGVDYSVYPGDNRVSSDDYRLNLQEFSRIARANHINIVFIKMPVNLPLGPGIISGAEARKFFKIGKSHFDKKDYPQAVSYLKKSLHYNPIFSEAYYYLGQCELHLGDRARAEKYFQEVKKCESFGCARDAIKYNKIMEDVAKEYGIPLVDIVEAFKRNKNEYLYLHPQEDTIHPNQLGHRIIAVELYNTIRGIIQEQLIKGG